MSKSVSLSLIRIIYFRTIDRQNLLHLLPLLSKNKLGWPLANIRNWYIYIRSLVSETFIPCVWCVLSRRTPIFYEDRCMPGLYKTPPCLRRQPLVSCQMIWSSKRWNSYRLKFAKAWSINIFFVIVSRFVRPQSIHLDCSRRSSLSERGIILNT